MLSDPPGYSRLQAVVSSNLLMHKRSNRLRLETNPSPSAVLGQFLANVVIYYLNPYTKFDKMLLKCHEKEIKQILVTVCKIQIVVYYQCCVLIELLLGYML